MCLFFVAFSIKAAKLVKTDDIRRVDPGVYEHKVAEESAIYNIRKYTIKNLHSFDDFAVPFRSMHITKNLIFLLLYHLANLYLSFC